MLYIFYLPQRQRFPCTICEKSYCQKGKLYFHVKTSHMSGRDNSTKCAYCEKTFATMVGKARHEAIVHMGRKEYTCDICDKTFGTKVQLAGHLRSVHMDKEDRLKCNQCNGAFSYNKTLKEHLKRCGKAENKEFQCSKCPAKFTTKQSQSRHEVSQHQDMPNICETYGQKFRYQFAYKRHIDRKHKN